MPHRIFGHLFSRITPTGKSNQWTPSTLMNRRQTLALGFPTKHFIWKIIWWNYQFPTLNQQKLPLLQAERRNLIRWRTGMKSLSVSTSETNTLATFSSSKNTRRQTMLLPSATLGQIKIVVLKCAVNVAWFCRLRVAKSLHARQRNIKRFIWLRVWVETLKGKVLDKGRMMLAAEGHLRWQHVPAQ